MGLFPKASCLFASFALFRESYTFILKSFALIRESYVFIRESFVLIRASYPFIRESFAFIRESDALIRENIIFFYTVNMAYINALWKKISKCVDLVPNLTHCEHCFEVRPI